MTFVQLKFKKVGNHWYLDIEHEDPSDLVISPVLERFLSIYDFFKSGEVDVYLIEQNGFIVQDGLVQFSDQDLLRYYTTNDKFMMDLFIQNHKYKISSTLYSILETKYKLDLHTVTYRLSTYEI